MGLVTNAGIAFCPDTILLRAINQYFFLKDTCQQFFFLKDPPGPFYSYHKLFLVLGRFRWYIQIPSSFDVLSV
jgi:hypothetical protein